MKTRFLLMSMALASVMVSCTDQMAEQFMWEEGVMAALPDYESESGTRVAFNNGLSAFTWSNGDCIGVCRSSASANATAAFTLLKGGDRVGNFINDSFSLLSQSDYYAFYPFVAGATASSFPMTMVTQTQEGNNSVSHIGPFNYMSAQFKTDDNGRASFTFSNIGTIIQVHFTADKEDTYRSLHITSNGKPFIIRGSYNLASETITSTETNGTFRITFGENGMHVTHGESVTVSAVILPCDMSQSTLTFSVKNAEGVAKEFSLAGFAFSKGKLYHFYEDDSRGEPPYGGCPDGKHPHMIDLGLPSGALWSCMNLGASVPSQLGVKFAWGQTDYVEKNESNWYNYEFMNDSYNNEWGINRYQIADNQTDGYWYNEEGVFSGDNKTTLELADDAARKNWGGTWKTPTRKEMEELFNYTVSAPVDNYNETGVPGYILYKKKSNNSYTLWDTHIFLPESHRYYYASWAQYWEDWYWTSSLGTDTRNAYVMYFRHGTSTSYNIGESTRTATHPIRPVRFTGNGGTSW